MRKLTLPTLFLDSDTYGIYLQRKLTHHPIIIVLVGFACFDFKKNSDMAIHTKNTSTGWAARKKSVRHHIYYGFFLSICCSDGIALAIPQISTPFYVVDFSAEFNRPILVSLVKSIY